MKTLIAMIPAVMLCAAGCSQSPPAGGAPPAPETTSSTAPAKLTPEEQALADAQKVCIVADEELGSMGTPIKVRVRDRDVFICCEGCRDALLADPDKYLAKLDAAEAAKSTPATESDADSGT
ncbi:MAG: hypothetical protein KF774_18780 [Planctomyces sp.]|nr:hypothetical protein [Planctomyces sp.]